jgi:hypothetical protein
MYTLSHNWVDVLIFYILLFGVAMDPKMNSINLGKSATETLAIIRQAFGEESMIRTMRVKGTSKLTKAEKGGTGEKQSQEHAHLLL